MLQETDLKYDFDRRELLPFLPGDVRSILDVGCGSGAFGRVLRAERPGLEMWAVEPDPVAAEVAREGFDNVLQGEFPDDRLPEGHFDVVVCADVLEHMADPRVGLAGAARVLAPGGVLVSSIPNVRNWRDVVWPLLRRGSWTYTERGILDATHLRFFTRRSMCALFVDNGWSVSTVSGINMGRRERIVSWLSRGALDEFLFPQYVVVATPNV